MTARVMRASYEYLRETPPFRRWHLPPGEKLRFSVFTSDEDMGRCYPDPLGIGVSRTYIGRTESLMVVMAHEMVHVYQMQKPEGFVLVEHDAEFRRLAARVCAVHGFDPLLF